METFSKTDFDGRDVARVIEKIETACEDEDTLTVLAAVITMAVLINKPEATEEEIIAGVSGASEWIALFTAGGTGPKTGGPVLN